MVFARAINTQKIDGDDDDNDDADDDDCIFRPVFSQTFGPGVHWIGPPFRMSP